ncbi:hypothetical protein QBC45DRAFT_224044 [Copromyces sp. CBS 386.78]|nr:hypothetical protein QBC45DRAFT_224044 [Copromyces sp. CBS 386.78]
MSSGLDGSLNGRLLRSEWTRGGHQESSSATPGPRPPLKLVDPRASGPVPVRLPGGQVRESRLAPRVAKVGPGLLPPVPGLLGMELGHWTSHSQTATRRPDRGQGTLYHLNFVAQATTRYKHIGYQTSITMLSGDWVDLELPAIETTAFVEAQTLSLARSPAPIMPASQPATGLGPDRPVVLCGRCLEALLFLYLFSLNCTIQEPIEREKATNSVTAKTRRQLFALPSTGNLGSFALLDRLLQHDALYTTHGSIALSSSYAELKSPFCVQNAILKGPSRTFKGGLCDIIILSYTPSTTSCTEISYKSSIESLRDFLRFNKLPSPLSTPLCLVHTLSLEDTVKCPLRPLCMML